MDELLAEKPDEVDKNNTDSSENDIPDIEIDDSPSIDGELRTFIDHISSLSATMDIAMKSIWVAFEKTRKEFLEFEKENVIRHEDNGKRELLVKADCAQQFNSLTKQLSTYSLAFKTIPRSYVMALISQYDAFLGRLLRVIYLTKPEMLNASERNLTFAQLVEFGSIDDAKEYILEKEIESILRKSHAEQFQILESKFDMPLRKGLNIWPTFIEITERRNLFVHTGGIVSSQYLKVCQEHNVPIKEIKVGDELTVNPKYFENAYNAVFEIGFKLAHVLWRKFIPDELGAADGNLIDIGFDALYSENYELTKMIFDFAAQTLKKYSREESRRIMIVNRSLAYKWSGDDKRAREMISQEDWSATRARFRLAEAVILENYDDAYEIMREIGKNRNEVAIEDYRTWPLFKAFKKTDGFQEVFKEIFDESYNKVEQPSIELPKELVSETESTLAQKGDECS